MNFNLIFYLVIPKIILAQINGEFWWLNKDIKKITGFDPPSPKFEELSEFDTDESSKIIFRDDLHFPTHRVPEKTEISKLNKNEDKTTNDLFDSASTTWLNSIMMPVSEETMDSDHKYEPIELENNSAKQTSEDLFNFKFPDDYSTLLMKHDEKTKKDAHIRNITKENKQYMAAKNDLQSVETAMKSKIMMDHFSKDVINFKFPQNSTGTDKVDTNRKMDQGSVVENMHSEKILFENESSTKLKDIIDSENICSFMTKDTCYKRNGIVYAPRRYKMRKFNNTNRICCILPLTKTKSNKIIFPDSVEIKPNRLKRSTTAMNQRDFLIKKRFGTQSIKTQTTTSNIKIVTPEDDYYVDPYWNIKNSNIKYPKSQSAIKQDCNYQDYVEDYVVELPKPGLVGIYSDQGQRPSSWFNENENPNPSYASDDDDDEGNSFGYSTVDPRRGTSKAPKRGRPIKITTAPPEQSTYDFESQTVSYQSNPNFQVLQGFKLLNLGRNKNKFHTKISRSTTEGVIEADSKESVNIESDPDGGEAEIGVQVFEQCGRTIVSYRQEIQDKQVGEAAPGSHPWLAIVVPARRPQAVLCYATILHPRAAITAGDCVSGYFKQNAATEVILIAGFRDIKDRSQTQNRKVIIQLHPRYRRENLGQNLALLHWETSLQLNEKVQPACLGSTFGGDDCEFVGWGGFDQAMRQRPRWQRAAVHQSEDCAAHFSKPIKLPSDAFCATVQSRGTVTGMGGSLICTQNGRAAVAGVAVYRDSALVMLPVQEWVVRALEDLRIV